MSEKNVFVEIEDEEEEDEKDYYVEVGVVLEEGHSPADQNVSTDVKPKVTQEVKPDVKSDQPIHEAVASQLEITIGTEIEDSHVTEPLPNKLEPSVEVKQEVIPSIDQTIDASQDVKQEITQEMNLEVKPEISQEVKSGAMQEVKPKISIETKPEFIQEDKPEVEPETKPEIKAEIIADIGINVQQDSSSKMQPKVQKEHIVSPSKEDQTAQDVIKVVDQQVKSLPSKVDLLTEGQMEDKEALYAKPSVIYVTSDKEVTDEYGSYVENFKLDEIATTEDTVNIKEEDTNDGKEEEEEEKEKKEEKEEEDENEELIVNDDKASSLKQTFPLHASIILDEMSPKPSWESLGECPVSKEEKFTVFGPSSFLDMPQPADEVDLLNIADTIERSYEVSCPLIETAKHHEDGEEEEELRPLHGIPLSLLKCFGQEKTLPVLSMSQGQELSILYACSHCGVFYDVENKQQYLLQGHRNSISCLAASYDKKVAIIGDKGPNSIVNVWQVLLEAKQMKPVKTFFNFQEYGVSAVAMSNTGTYLAIISANPTQSLTIWNWTDPSDIPIVEVKINPDYGYQKDITFNVEDSSQLVSNSETQVIFYAWNENMIKYYSHQITGTDLHKIGKFTTTVFFKNAYSALSATNLGKFVVWEKYKSHLMDGLTPFKRVQKIVRMQNKPITVLTAVNKMIVTGDAIGQIKFYDETLKLVNWFQDVNLGSITSISFDFCPDSVKTKQDDSFILETYMKGNAFTTPNFIFGTSMARFVYVTANGTKYDIVSDDFDCPVVAIDIHPYKPVIAVGGQNGFLKLLHYKHGDSVASKLLENGKNTISCLKYNSDGSMLAVGLSNGKVEVLHGLNLRSFCKTFLNDTSEAITHIIFSHHMQYMATADAGHAVTLYSILKDKIWIDENQNFKFIGRYKAHHKPIRSILFRTSGENNVVKLYSLSLDRHLAEYEIVRGPNGLALKSRDRVEQFGIPLFMASYPRMTRDDFVIICNDQFKFKLLNSLSRICRKTLLGPKFGTPVEKFVVSSAKDSTSNNDETHFLACMLGDKIAISLLPITGNQHRSFGMISHPTGVKNIVVSSDGKYMFSVGGSSASLMMWSINLAALEIQERLGGSDLAPFYEQIKGGKNSFFMYHLENLFYFAQIRNQGIHTRDKRNVGVKVPLAEIPSIMRALGYYPTEQEIFTMINEIRYENFAETGETVDSIDVGQFLKLYINHKPVKHNQEKELQSAFQILGRRSDDGRFVIEGDELVRQLLNNGEPMTESELADCLATFAGIIRNADICTKQNNVDPMGVLFPEKLDTELFKQLLGFERDE